jgi:hypothetical protein
MASEGDSGEQQNEDLQAGLLSGPEVATASMVANDAPAIESGAPDGPGAGPAESPAHGEMESGIGRVVYG